MRRDTDASAAPTESATIVLVLRAPARIAAAPAAIVFQSLRASARIAAAAATIVQSLGAPARIAAAATRIAAVSNFAAAARFSLRHGPSPCRIVDAYRRV
jgi:hypothetical protein